MKAKVDTSKPRTADFLAMIIRKGTYTRKQVRQAFFNMYPDYAESTFTTMIADAKNSRYTRLGNGNVIVEHPTTKKLGFRTNIRRIK